MKKKPEDGDDKSTKVQPIGSIGNLADDNERNAQRAWGQISHLVQEFSKKKNRKRQMKNKKTRTDY